MRPTALVWGIMAALLVLMSVASSGYAYQQGYPLRVPMDTQQARYLNCPEWFIYIDSEGYSDGWIANADTTFHCVSHNHELLSGEWAAAIYYEGVVNSGVDPSAPQGTATWLTPEFVCPDWHTNSAFRDTLFALGTWDNPLNPVNGTDTGSSLITNGQVTIRIDYEIADLGQVFTSPMGTEPGPGIGVVASSSRYVLLQTYTITNISGDTLRDVEFYQMLSGHPGDEYGPVVSTVYNSYPYPDPLLTGYVPFNPVHKVGNFRYDITQWNNPGDPMASSFWKDWIGFSSTVEPTAVGNNLFVGSCVNGKPESPGTHWDVEGRSLNGLLSTYGEIAGAAMWAFGTLADQDSVSLTVALMFGAMDCNENDTSDVCDIWRGTSRDADYDGVPDECPAPEGILELDYFQDQFAEDGTLNPTSTADTRTAANQGGLAPPIFGDTLVYRNSADDIEVWLRFRMVAVSPQQAFTHDFFSMWFPNVQGGTWFDVRMDTAEVTDLSGTGRVPVVGRYMTCFHESDPIRIAWDLPEGTEILPNNLFVPGTRIEYFLKICHVGSMDTSYVPAAAQSDPEEFEILPMMRDDGMGGLEWPCLIVADHFGQRGNWYERNSHRIARHLTANDYDFDMFNKLAPTGSLMNGIGRWPANPGQAGGPGTPSYNSGPGATPDQMAAYTHCMLNAGSVYEGSVDSADVSLLQSWLVNSTGGEVSRFFWLSGDQVCRELHTHVPWGRQFLNNVLGAVYVSRSFAHATGILAFCLPTNAILGGHLSFPPCNQQYIIRMNDAPRDFNVISASGSCPTSVIEREYDAAVPHRYSAVSNVLSFAGGPNYKAFVEGYDNCLIRSDAALGSPACGDDNYMTTWFNCVLTWAGYSVSSLCNTSILIGAELNHGAVQAVVTSLTDACPNPMNPTATIKYSVGTPGKVQLRVFDVSGRVIRTLVDETKITGTYSVIWDGANDRGEKVASGVFFYQLEAAGIRSAKKMVIMR